MASLGLCAYGIPAAELIELAKCADTLGFDALWLGEHVLRPVAYTSEHPTSGTQHHSGPIVDEGTELVDPWVVHAAIAAVTVRIKLGTAMYVTPLRHPLQTARTTIDVQELSNGRVLFGIGAGWLQEEFAAFEVPYRTRYSRTEECIQILRKAWTGTEFSHTGKHFRFDTVQVHPRPASIPIVLGGNMPKALARAARLGDAWFSSGTPSLDESNRYVDQLRVLRAEAGRTDEFRCYVRVADPSVGELERYWDRGLDDLVVWADMLWKGETLEERRSSLIDAAHRIGLPTVGAG